MLSKLIEESKIKFNKTELFLLEAAAYLHDIGMLIDLDGFIEERAEKHWEHEPTLEPPKNDVVSRGML